MHSGKFNSFSVTILFLSAVFLSGCSSLSEKSQCNPDKNYLISNPQAMEEYKLLRKNGEVNGYYTVTLPPKPCYTNICVSIEDSNEYIEKFFDDKERKGVYTIKAYKNKEGRNCITEDPATINNKIKYCYEVTKNNNEEVKSRYKYTYDKRNKGQTIIVFSDIKNNIKLYEYSYQIYSTKALGGTGFGTCKPNDNNPNYKFNAVSFPTDD